MSPAPIQSAKSLKTNWSTALIAITHGCTHGSIGDVLHVSLRLDSHFVVLGILIHVFFLRWLTAIIIAQSLQKNP